MFQFLNQLTYQQLGFKFQNDPNFDLALYQSLLVINNCISRFSYRALIFILHYCCAHSIKNVNLTCKLIIIEYLSELFQSIDSMLTDQGIIQMGTTLIRILDVKLTLPTANFIMGPNQPELIFRSSHLIFSIATVLHSSVFTFVENLEKVFSLHIFTLPKIAPLYSVLPKTRSKPLQINCGVVFVILNY